MTEAPKKNRQDWGVGRAAFFAHAAAICAEIEQGWPVTVVHEKFKDRVNLSYRQFNRHVRAHQNKKRLAAAGKQMAASPVRAPASPRGAGELASSGTPTFHFDPMDAYRKKFV